MQLKCNAFFCLYFSSIKEWTLTYLNFESSLFTRLIYCSYLQVIRDGKCYTCLSKGIGFKWNTSNKNSRFNCFIFSPRQYTLHHIVFSSIYMYICMCLCVCVCLYVLRACAWVCGCVSNIVIIYERDAIFSGFFSTNLKSTYHTKQLLN